MKRNAKHDKLIDSPATDEGSKSKKKKIQKPAKPIKEVEQNVETAPEVYKPGMLSSIFGKTSTVDEIAPEVLKGDTVIQVKKKKVISKPKMRVNVSEVDESANSAEIDSENSNDTENKTFPKKSLDRRVQRANRDLKKGGKGNVEEMKRTIFVGNAPVEYTVKDIKKVFRDCGDIESIRIRGIVPPKETLSKRICNSRRKFHWNQNSVIFYVKFKEEASAIKAIEYNGKEIDGHKIRVSIASKKKDYDRNTTIYIGNLPFTAQEDAIAALFEEHVGPVTFVRCTRDNGTGMGKGFGFVSFKETSSVDLALELTNLEYEGRTIRITKLMKKQQIEKAAAGLKKYAGVQKKTQPSKIDNFKFSTKEKKPRTEEQTERRKLKKTARKAINRKQQQKKGKSLMN